MAKTDHTAKKYIDQVSPNNCQFCTLCFENMTHPVDLIQTAADPRSTEMIRGQTARPGPWHSVSSLGPCVGDGLANRQAGPPWSVQVTDGVNSLELPPVPHKPWCPDSLGVRLTLTHTSVCFWWPVALRFLYKTALPSPCPDGLLRALTRSIKELLE